MPKLSKDVLYPGTWRLHDGRLFKCSPNEIPHFEKRLSEMLGVGLNIPMAWEHQPGVVPLDQEELQKQIADKAKKTVGWAESPAARAGKLETIFNVPDEAEAKKLETVRFISPGIQNDYVDTKGRLWPGRSIIHFAITDRPVQHEQKPFKPVSENAPMFLSLDGLTNNDDVDLSGNDEDWVAIGTKIEMEHVNDEVIARSIAQFRLKDDPDYYRRLRQKKPSVPLGATLSQTDPAPHIGEGLRTHGGLAKSKATLALVSAHKAGGRSDHHAVKASLHAHAASQEANDPLGHTKAMNAHAEAASIHGGYASHSEGEAKEHHLQAREYHDQAFWHHRDEKLGRPTNLSAGDDTVELANAKLHVEGRTQVNTKIPTATAVAQPLEHHEIAKHYAGLAMQHAKTTQGPALHQSFMAHEASKKAKSPEEHLQAAHAHTAAGVAHNSTGNAEASAHHFKASEHHMHAAKALSAAAKAGAQPLRTAPTPGKGQAVHLSAKGKGRSKIGKVMREFSKGKLKTSAGSKVTNKKQAVAIAYSEARRAGAKLSQGDVVELSAIGDYTKAHGAALAATAAAHKASKKAGPYAHTVHPDTALRHAALGEHSHATYAHEQISNDHFAHGHNEASDLHVAAAEAHRHAHRLATRLGRGHDSKGMALSQADRGATMADDKKDDDDGWRDDFPSLVKVINEEFGGNVLGDDVTEDNFGQRFIAAMRAVDLTEDDETYTPPTHEGQMKEVQTGLLTLSQQEKTKYDTEMLSLKAAHEAEKKRADILEHRQLTGDRAAAKERVNKLVPKVLSKPEADAFCAEIDKEMVKLSLEEGHKYPCIIRLEAFEQVAARIPTDRFNLSNQAPKEIAMPAKSPAEVQADAEKNGKAQGAELAGMVGYTRK